MRSLLAVETAGRDPNRMEEKSNTEPARNIPLELRTKTTAAVVAGLQLDPRLSNDTQRIKQFTAETCLSRATHFRVKANLPKPTPPPRNVLRRSTTLRLVVDGL